MLHLSILFKGIFIAAAVLTIYAYLKFLLGCEGITLKVWKRKKG